MSQPTISERFIDTMVEIRALDRLTGNDEPMRHVIRQLKQAAERAIEDALVQAWQLAYTANRLPKESREIVEEALAATLPEKNT